MPIALMSYRCLCFLANAAHLSGEGEYDTDYHGIHKYLAIIMHPEPLIIFEY